METNDYKRIVESFLQAVIREDVEDMRPLVRDDVVWWVPASSAIRFKMPRRLAGWSNIPWLGGAGWKGFEPGTSSIVVHHMVSENELVSAHYSRTAKLVGGADYEAEYNILFRLVGGQIAEVWEIADTATAMGFVR
jgi:ketosteroid isomerase-like protein